MWVLDKVYTKDKVFDDFFAVSYNKFFCKVVLRNKTVIDDYREDYKYKLFNTETKKYKTLNGINALANHVDSGEIWGTQMNFVFVINSSLRKILSFINPMEDAVLFLECLFRSDLKFKVENGVLQIYAPCPPSTYTCLKNLHITCPDNTFKRHLLKYGLLS